MRDGGLGRDDQVLASDAQKDERRAYGLNDERGVTCPMMRQVAFGTLVITFLSHCHKPGSFG